MTQTFHANSLNAYPGDHRVELTAPWESLDAGEIVVPLSGGFNNINGRHERTISVTSTGETITGAF